MAHSTLTPADAEAIAKPVRSFVADSVIPLEQEAFAAGVDDALRIRLQQAARDAGLLAPQAPAEYGGGGADFLTTGVLLEEAGYSPLGPLALNCAAPDEGNIHLLAMVGSQPQKERYLRPLVRGEVRSCFAMTEPAPGAGSDPAALTSTARKVSGGWRLNGVKHFITGADGAGFAIVMVKSQGPDAPEGASMFLIDADNPGWQVGDRMRTIDEGTVGGHCQVQLRDAFVADDAVLGEPGRGFAHAQVRLVPARLTHCMRWLGAARRAHEIALRRTSGRELFGVPLGSLGMAQQLIADNEIELAACRALLWQVAGQVMQGVKGTEESSRAKVNLRAPFALVQACLPALRQAAAARPDRGARIVAVASVLGIVSVPGLAAYSAAKAGLISLCQSVNGEESAAGVTATAIAPGLSTPT